MDLLGSRRVDPIHQSPRTRMYGYFTHGTDPPSPPLLIWFLLSPRSSSSAAFPNPFRCRFLGHKLSLASGVGSEVARLRAGHRPPLKLHVRFSRMQLSRRLTLPRCNRRDQLKQVDQPVLAV